MKLKRFIHSIVNALLIILFYALVTFIVNVHNFSIEDKLQFSIVKEAHPDSIIMQRYIGLGKDSVITYYRK